MPLNIDWQQILLHAFNFIILAAGLTFILFKPVRKFMRERQEKYRAAAEEHAKKKAEIAAMEEERKQKIAGLDEELAAHRREVLERAEARSRQIVAAAQEEAQDILAQGRKRAEEERAAYLADAGDEIADMVVKSAEKLLVVGSTPENDRALYDSYLKTASENISVSGTARERAANAKRRGASECGDNSPQSVAEAVGDAALAAIGRGRTAASDGAVYDEFLKSVSGGGDGKQ